ncbi:hypothetical protein [Methanolobus vulcani]|uniref:Uncharacterized protein n=1 Tax=Methanolobus vulcani TaxID=38026 RepID=A0A7Z8KQN7_9EURY|nr:hypothetical protein [Methanolobus vulcani]TQD28266.1 hypothetical protein FKV42_00925 [Methanolobus vulcani]
MMNISLKQPGNIAGMLMFFGILSYIASCIFAGTLPEEGMDSLAGFGIAIFIPGFLVWFGFSAVSWIRNVNKIKW